MLGTDFLNENGIMSAEGTTSEPEKSFPQPENAVKPTSKQAIRKKVWDHLEKYRIVTFPRPIFGRIPNFKGTEEAALKLLELEEFTTAKCVEVNLDKPSEPTRVLVVESDKILYVPVPQLQEGLLKKISFCNEDKPANMKAAVTRWGIEILGKPVDFDDNLHIDLVVLGSVAVSREGRRIGKGRGYADLEYAILKEMKTIDDDTPIVTTVHDSQVFETLPDELFEKHDVPVDYILTPTEIIKIEKKLPRPEGIYWDLVTPRKLLLMPVLQIIREMHERESRNTTLGEVFPDPEYENPEKLVEEKQYPSQGPPSDRSGEENDDASFSDLPKPRRARLFRRTRCVTNENEDPIRQDIDEASTLRKKNRHYRRTPRRLQVDFSLVVSNIDRNVRVRTLKDALIDHGIKPNNITWRGYKGFCYLHYVKPVKNEDDQEETKPFGVDNVIEILQTLKLNPESTPNLSVKVMEPITRIETTDVSSV